MKVKIFTECSKTVGYGHVVRCLALYDEILHRNIHVELIIQGDLENVDLLNGKNYANEEWVNVEYLRKTISNEDYVIVDSYHAEVEHYEIIALKSSKALYIDDVGRIQYPPGIIINPSFNSSFARYDYKSSEQVFIGSDYVILRSPFNEIYPSTCKYNVTKALVIMGGTDVRNITGQIIESICDQNQDVNFEVIVNADQYKRLALKNIRKNVYFYKNLSANEMCKKMLDSDISISAAGQTIYELVVTNTPFIAIQVADNQKNNIESLISHFPSQIILKYDEVDFNCKLQKQFKKIKTFDFRVKMIKEMIGAIDGKGSKRIVDLFLGERNIIPEFNLRNVRMDDCRDVFELSNKDYVRLYSIQNEKILWEDHVKWFYNVLKDENTVFYIITDRFHSFSGQVRFKIENSHATISISLSDRVKGKGLAKQILSQSIKSVFEENSNVTNIIAYVSEHNIASMKIFKGLNFEIVDIDDFMIKLVLGRNGYYAN